MNLKRAKKEALDYIWPACMFAMYDCSDSMHDAEKQQARFDAIVDDKIKIEDFIKQHLLSEYVDELKKAVDECDYDGSMECGVSDFPVPWKDVKEEYEKRYGEWKHK